MHPTPRAPLMPGSDVEQDVRGVGSVGWMSSWAGAVDGRGQRRWVRLTFAGRDGMIGNCRELPRSSVAGHRWGWVPHRFCGGFPCGGAHPLLQPVRAGGCCWCSGARVEWLVGGDRLDGPGELAGGRDDDLLVRLAVGGHPGPAAVQALLGAPRALECQRVLAALAGGERLADAGTLARMPGGSTSSRRTWPLPALVIDPWERCWPEDRSEGTRPT